MSTRTANHDEPIVQTVAEPLHQILKKAAAEAAGSPEPEPAPAPAARTKPVAPKTLAFRPTGRQPLATLTILDDGDRKEGELVRIRDSRLVIGRDEGDVRIPFDTDISGQHAELRCQAQGGKFQWYLIDLGSTNGTFLRAYRASLSKKMELVLGSRRYQFQLPENPVEDDDGDISETRRYQAPSRTLVEKFLPRLAEVGAADGNSFSFGKPSLTFGRDASCDMCAPDDPFLSPRHARFYQDERGRWMVEDKKSLNGIWLKIRRLALSQPAEFQIGQQRFRFQPNVEA